MFGSGPVPFSLTTAEFMLRPLTAAHTELDHAALMTSTELLRMWSGTDWPSDDFSLDENRLDLERHEREHREGVAFTFTVLTPGETECLGCVYVTPLWFLQETNAEVLGAVSLDEAVVGFWIKQPRLADDLDRGLLAVLRRWFAEEWDFSAVYFSTREMNARQLKLMSEAGLPERFRLSIPNRGSFILFECV